jgi:hydrogenase expression/formation protein HypC
MCLAIPSKIVQKNGNLAVIDVDGVRRDANLMLLEDAEVGDWIIVHAGFAIHKIDEKSALETISFLREAAEFSERQP